MRVRIVRTLAEEEWRRLVEAHPAGNIFHTPEMFRVFAKTKGHHPTLWATVDDNNCPLALLTPVQITLAGGPFRWVTTRAVVYGGVLCTPDPAGKAALGMLLQAYGQETKASILFTELRNLNELQDIGSVLEDNGFVHEDHLNFVVDLCVPVDEMWNRLDPNARSNVKKARRKGIVVEEAGSSETIQVAYHLLQQVYKRIRVPLTDASLFQAAFDVLQPKNMIKIFMARLEDKYIGTSIVLLYKDVIYGWYAGATQEYSSYKTGDLLNWHVLEWGAQHGFGSFDFGGAGKPDEDYGPRKFKAKFGGTLVNYGRNTRIHAPLFFQISKKAYAWTRLLWSLRSTEQKILEK
jgi:serine/alanine adding enzyme